jgi:hypothetical protein
MASSKFYKQIADAAASGGGVYINDGIYTFMIEKMLVKEADYTGGGTSFIAEFRVLESEVHPSFPNVKPNAVGTTCSVVFAVSKHAAAFGNAKALLCAALAPFGYTESEIGPEEIEKAFNTDQLVGLILKDKTYQKAIKGGDNKGNMITLNRWETVEQTVEDVAKQKADLAAGKYDPPKKDKGASTEDAPAAKAKTGGSLLKKPA